MSTSMMESRRPQDWINLLLAVCLFLSPWLFGFTGDITPTRNAWIVGVALAVIAIAALTAFAEWEEWVNLGLGAWLIVAPWVLGFAGQSEATWVHVVFGLIAFAVSAWAVWDYRHSEHPA